MITREDIIGESRRLGFGDVGFTTAEPFTAHLDYLRSHQAEYGWVEKAGLALLDGTDPKTVLPAAKSIIVLLELYFREAFPVSLESHFGRCYLDDDRMTRDGLAPRIKAFRDFLRRGGPGRHGNVRKKLPLLCRQNGPPKLLGASRHGGGRS